MAMSQMGEVTKGGRSRTRSWEADAEKCSLQ